MKWIFFLNNWFYFKDCVMLVYFEVLYEVLFIYLLFMCLIEVENFFVLIFGSYYFV